MSGATQSFFLFLTYSITIVGVFIWSGTITEKTLYDKFIIRFEGSTISVSDKKAAVSFYSEVLNFSPVRSKAKTGNENIAGFELPDKHRFLLESETDSSLPRAAAAVIRVRNGFTKLHRELTARSRKFFNNETPQESDSGSVSEILDGPWGQQFIVKDFDGNRIIFYHPKNLLFRRSS